MPVGRFVLDVHGESNATWAASDALCAALQINNHLQDCGKDYHSLNRVYLPQDAMDAAGVKVEAIGEPQASPALRKCLLDLTLGAERLLHESLVLAPQVENTRLALEIGVIQTYAQKIIDMLKVRDPLVERVHLNKWEVLGFSLTSIAGGLLRRAGRSSTTGQTSRAA
jgi:hydroxysqualene synthase